MANAPHRPASNLLTALFALFVCGTVCGTMALRVWATPPSLLADGEANAKRALDADKVAAFDSTLKFLFQTVVEKPVGGSDREIRDDLAGPGPGVKSSVEYRVYDRAQAAAAHANPGPAAEGAEYDLPQGAYNAYHSNLGGDIAKDVPLTFHCLALKGKTPLSRCYYYAGGASATVVVGTTNSTAPNEAIMITAMGAQALAQLKP